MYNSSRSQTDGIVFQVSQFVLSIYRSTNQFYVNFAYHAPRIWTDLSDDV